VNYLRDAGFTDQELAQAWNGQASISPRDSRFQKLVHDAARYVEAQKNATKTYKRLSLCHPFRSPALLRPRAVATSN
jgi:hypothetical protein